MKFDLMCPETFTRIKGRGFFDLLFDSIFGVWFGQYNWSTATWTLSIELIATFFIYLLSQLGYNYRGRFWIYLFAIAFITVP